MTKLTLQFPDSLARGIKELAAKDGYTIDQFILSAAAEKLSALNTVDYLRERAARADLKEFDRILDQVPDREPDQEDRFE